MKSKFFGRFAKMAVAILAVGLSMTSCYDEEVGNLQVVMPEPAPEVASYELYGTVTNSTTFAPVAGANVFVNGQNLKAQTDANGNYSVVSENPIQGTVSFECEGYTTVEKSVNMTAVTSGTSKLKLDVAMSEYSNHGDDSHDDSHDKDHGHDAGNANAGGGSAE